MAPLKKKQSIVSSGEDKKEKPPSELGNYTSVPSSYSHYIVYSHHIGGVNEGQATWLKDLKTYISMLNSSHTFFMISLLAFNLELHT